MLLLKKNLHRIFLLKKEQNIKYKVNTFLIYEDLFRSFLSFISFIMLNCLLKKRVLLFFSYVLKLGSVDKSLLNNNLLCLIERLKSFNLDLIFQLNKVRVLKKEYTVLRSPFVYKKSREQFIIDKQNSSFFLGIGSVSWFKFMFLNDFFEKLLLSLNSISTLLIKVGYPIYDDGYPSDYHQLPYYPVCRYT